VQNFSKGIIFFSLFLVIPFLSPKPHLELLLKTDKQSYSPKEPILIQLIVTNKTNKVFRSTFSSTQKYDFVVRKEKEEIWRWSKDKVFAMVLTEFKLQPQESVTYQDRWTQQDEEGRTIPAGEYEIIGILKTQPEIISPTLSIKITP
jgi:hypothetical protein